jgi:serine protease Do
VPALSLAGLSALFLLTWVIRLSAQDDLGSKISCELRRVYDERRDSVVRVEALDSHGKLCGTGFFIDPSGTIYTLAYIVANADEILVCRGDRKIPARLLVADPRSGIALIKADLTSPFIPTGSSRSMPLASPILSIGYPEETRTEMNFGIIGGFDHQFLGKYFTTTHIRANLAVQPGFGGAPLLNLNGDVIGIIISSIGGGAGCYAVPIEAAEKIRMDYARFGEPRHGWLGVNAEQQTDAVGGSHVRISEVGPETPAATSGLKKGDILLQVGDIKIVQPEDIIDASFFITAGDTVPVVVMRGDQRLVLDVRSTRHPASETPSPFPAELHVVLPDTNDSMQLK